MQNNLQKMLDSLVEISSNKEQSALETGIAKTLCQLIASDLFFLEVFDSRGDFSPRILIAAYFDKEIRLEAWHTKELTSEWKNEISEYLKILESNLPDKVYQQNSGLYWPLYSANICSNLVVIKKSKLSEIELVTVRAVSQLFTNFTGLLAAGEKDALTGLYNRRVFDARFSRLVQQTPSFESREIERRSEQRRVGNFLGIIDIDHFKNVNDQFGHLFGDEVLLWLAQQMRSSFRKQDSLFRYGGEEFAVLLIGLDSSRAKDAFERFREKIAVSKFPQIGHISVSVGYTCILENSSPTVVFGEADQALYYVKVHGRNDVASFQRLVEKQLIEVATDTSSEVDLF